MLVLPPLLHPLLDPESPLALNSLPALALMTLNARVDAVDSTLASVLVPLLPWSVTAVVASVMPFPTTMLLAVSEAKQGALLSPVPPTEFKGFLKRMVWPSHRILRSVWW